MSPLEHVIVVNDHGYINGGQAKVAIDSAIALAESGTDVTFFAPCGPMDPALAQAGVRTVCLNQNDLFSEPNRLRAGLRGLWNRTAAKALRDLIAQFDPERAIIHAHGFAKALSPSIGPVLTGGPLAHVFTMHEFFLACPNGGFFNYQTETICTLKPMGARCTLTHCDSRQRSHKLWRLIRHAVLKGPGGLPRALQDVIYISDTQRRMMEPFLNPDVRLHHVSHPMTVGTPSRAPVEHNSAFVFLGRLRPEKGALAFATAAAKAGVEAVFVGDGDQRAAVQAANADAHITGWLSPAETQAHLRRARALVLPSLWTENFPLTACEALAHGVPVISGAWNAAAEIVVDQENGVIVPDMRPDTLGKAFAAVNQRAAALSHTAFDRFWANERARPSHVARLNQVYTAALARQGPALRDRRVKRRPSVKPAPGESQAAPKPQDPRPAEPQDADQPNEHTRPVAAPPLV